MDMGEGVIMNEWEERGMVVVRCSLKTIKKSNSIICTPGCLFEGVRMELRFGTLPPDEMP